MEMARAPLPRTVCMKSRILLILSLKLGCQFTQSRAPGHTKTGSHADRSGRNDAKKGRMPLHPKHTFRGKVFVISSLSPRHSD